MFKVSSRSTACAAMLFTLTTLLLTASSAASADPVRAAEWPLDAQHLQADRIWAISRGAGTVVAVIDSGVSATHHDLTGQVLPGTSMVGDSGDGRTDTSGDSHGTAIAGIIAANGGSQGGDGMQGLAPDAKILPVRVSSDGQVTAPVLAQGIVWAADHGAQVINISMGSPNPDPLLRQAVTYAMNKDIVIVASAGNQGQSDNTPMYPAQFPGVISVSGTDRTESVWPQSEHGPGITIAAPASDIYSTNDQGQYVHADGTSYAAGYVSAAAALVRSHEPHLTAGQTVRRLITATSNHHQFPDAHLGYGELNPLAALTTASDPGGPENPLLHPLAAPRTDAGGTTTITIAGAALGVAVLATLTVVLRRRRKRPGDAQVHPQMADRCAHHPKGKGSTNPVKSRNGSTKAGPSRIRTGNRRR